MPRVLSLGAGVQSSVVLLMSARGELPPLDAAVFADTKWEPRAVYEHLDWLEAEAGVPLVRTDNGRSLKQDTIDGVNNAGRKGYAMIPLYTGRGASGGSRDRPDRRANGVRLARRTRTTFSRRTTTCTATGTTSAIPSAAPAAGCTATACGTDRDLREKASALTGEACPRCGGHSPRGSLCEPCDQWLGGRPRLAACGFMTYAEVYRWRRRTLAPAREEHDR